MGMSVGDRVKVSDPLPIDEIYRNQEGSVIAIRNRSDDMFGFFFNVQVLLDEGEMMVAFGDDELTVIEPAASRSETDIEIEKWKAHYA